MLIQLLSKVVHRNSSHTNVSEWPLFTFAQRSMFQDSEGWVSQTVMGGLALDSQDEKSVSQGSCDVRWLSVAGFQEDVAIQYNHPPTP